MGTYEELLQEQAQCLTRLKAQRGNPSLRVIEARAKKLFADEKVSLPPATQSTAFGGGYLSQDKLIWLVRTLLSWDRFGRECDPPAYGEPVLDEWYDRWTGIATAKQARRRKAAEPPTSSGVEIAEGEVPLAPSAPTPAVEAVTGDPLTEPALRAHAVAFSPDGSYLATTSEDGTVRFWDPVTRRSIGAPLTIGHGQAVPTSDRDGPFDGVPEHLQLPLQEWVAYALDSESLVDHLDEDRAERTICLRLRLVAKVDEKNRGGSKYHRALTTTVGTQLLDVVDAVLAYKAERGVSDQDDIRLLTDILDAAGSAYRVAEAGDGLEQRVTPTVRDAVRQTITSAAPVPAARSAANHLASAWQAAHGRSPDPVRAYGESIKAVEAAAHSIIQPNNDKATLGTMLGEIRNARHKFATALFVPAGGGAPIAPTEAMMRALWEGQTSRHGAQSQTVPETLEAARAGVHLAATLVQWFVSGAVVRTP
ncbi:WD40 domain-containing protein (plasmid) [Streptomyces erythrochromogenes]|uniref:WD40 domain-containing protein n=1 Tax=Streptomyces erythrochromogenes TaxID=285574 RepID=A0ABZ1QPS5_9ACTN|nr:WD40 repeat domain-containing protein [Streptomyces erythrochromogenes]